MHTFTIAPFNLPFLLIFTFLLINLHTTSAQGDFMFEYYIQGTGCTAHVPPGSGASQGIGTTDDYQCFPVNNALDGTFDVRISERVFWVNGIKPVVKACPTVDCDTYPDNGCCEFLFFVFESGEEMRDAGFDGESRKVLYISMWVLT